MPRTIACYTLGCKVNQYDTQAMLELFMEAGYKNVPFDDEADVYLINTCTVTGTGDQKSLKTIRHVNRLHPQSSIIVAGCLAQRDAPAVSLPGVRLIIGCRMRSQVVNLLNRAIREDVLITAVESSGVWEFENLRVTGHEGRTRAVMKIQEGCDRYCAYCVIPYVRGPIRSMPLESVKSEAMRLAAADYREIVVTGIHLASYARGTSASLLDAIEVINGVPGIERIRLGSLEPAIVTPKWVESLKKYSKLCPQFHLSLQSGSASVLKRMRRRYTPEEYLQAARLLKGAYEDCAITTDVLCGFPGETQDEAAQTEDFVKLVGFAKMHVFPYSRRAGTAADGFPGQLPENVKHERAQRLIDIGNKMRSDFVQNLVGKTQSVLFETQVDKSLSQGYTGNYVRVIAPSPPLSYVKCLVTKAEGDTLYADVL